MNDRTFHNWELTRWTDKLAQQTYERQLLENEASKVQDNLESLHRDVKETRLFIRYHKRKLAALEATKKAKR